MRDFDDFDRTAKRTFGAIIGLWLLGALLSLGFTAVVIWAIVQLVQHFTA